jgi:GNAT superfamily N-acetyltransferase
MDIRQATARDSLLLSTLCTHVQRIHADSHPEIFKRPERPDFAVAFFDEMLADPTVRIYIAEEDTQALGYVFCRLFERPESVFTHARRVLQIEHISVRPVAQRRGVGTALINRVEQLAGELGVSMVQLDSWDFNLEAHAFFVKMMFEQYNHRFWKIL